MQSIFAEVFKRTHEEWLDGFRRDFNPESEIRLWEAMASAYQTFLGEHALSLPAKKEALGLLCSGQSPSTASLRYWPPGFGCFYAVPWPPGIPTNASWRLRVRYGPAPSPLAQKLADKLDLIFLTRRKGEHTVLTSEVRQ